MPNAVSGLHTLRCRIEPRTGLTRKGGPVRPVSAPFACRVRGGHRGIQPGVDRRHLHGRCSGADSGRGLGNERTAIRHKAAVWAVAIALGASPIVLGAAFVADRGMLAGAVLIAFQGSIHRIRASGHRRP
jgi:hypothetical protein